MGKTNLFVTSLGFIPVVNDTELRRDIFDKCTSNLYGNVFCENLFKSSIIFRIYEKNDYCNVPKDLGYLLLALRNDLDECYLDFAMYKESKLTEEHFEGAKALLKAMGFKSFHTLLKNDANDSDLFLDNGAEPREKYENEMMYVTDI